MNFSFEKYKYFEFICIDFRPTNLQMGAITEIIAQNFILRSK